MAKKISQVQGVLRFVLPSTDDFRVFVIWRSISLSYCIISFHSIMFLYLKLAVRASPKVSYIFLPKIPCLPTQKGIRRRKECHLQEYPIFDFQNMVPHTFFMGTFFFSIGILFCQHFYIQYMSRPSSGNQQTKRQQQPAISII